MRYMPACVCQSRVSKEILLAVAANRSIGLQEIAQLFVTDYAYDFKMCSRQNWIKLYVVAT